MSQRIIELMGGAIKVSSVVGQGSTFYFHLRFEMAQGADKALLENVDGDPEEAPDFSAYRVLIVDDIRVNRLVAVGLLKNTQIMHEEAENGQQAVKMFMDSEPGYYDCILMDVRMPVLDGVAATRVIRAADRPDASRVIILAMTANVFTEDVKEVLEAGMDGYIAKPVEYKNLIKTLRRLLNKRL